jgi:hypothetical protein
MHPELPFRTVARRVRSASSAAALLVFALLGWALPSAHAAPIVPASDDEVIEVLPASAADRFEERRARKALASRPDDAALAVSVARHDLERARELGDPRFAGRALAAIARWTDPRTVPADVLLARATVQQYLHEFDASAQTLQALLARPDPAPRSQAWLTVATVRRVQGRYDDSDAACREVGRTGAELHARACLAENAGLRGETAAARRTFAELLSKPGLAPATLGWLLTSVAELEERDAQPAAAEAAYRTVLQIERDAYATLAYADFLIARQRPGEALRLLADQPRTDAVLLRLAIAGTLAHAPSAAHDVAEMRERIALANERPDARLLHGREQAMFALHVEHDAKRALELARGNVARQREPLDWLVYAQAARASGDAQARREVRRARDATGLRDRRIDAEL